MTGTTWTNPAQEGDWPSVDLRTDLPHPARVYDYLLGGKDNYAADRAAGDEALRVNPDGRTPVRENRAFLRRAVRYLALSHLTGDFAPEMLDGVVEAYARNGMVLKVRSRPEVEHFFTGLNLAEPGVQSLPRWRPDNGAGEQSPPADARVSCYGGLARKPLPHGPLMEKMVRLLRVVPVVTLRSLVLGRPPAGQLPD